MAQYHVVSLQGDLVAVSRLTVGEAMEGCEMAMVLFLRRLDLFLMLTWFGCLFEGKVVFVLNASLSHSQTSIMIVNSPLLTASRSPDCHY
jgi:hypothetical protein